MTRKSGTASLALLAVLLMAGAYAQPYPSKPVRMVVGFAPGGGSDLLARAISNETGEALGQPMVIDNKPGAAGVIANELVAKSPPDGYTLLVGSAAAFSIVPHMLAKPPYDAIRDYAAVSPFARNTFVLLAHPSLKANSVKELIALARENPGRINYGSAGNGSFQHLAMAQFESMAGIQMTHVPYKSTAPALQDVVGGRIELLFNTTGISVPFVKEGKLRVLAVSTGKRAELFPGVPTMDEAGVKGFDVFNWFGLFAPAGTPRPVIERLNDAVNKSLRNPKVMERLQAAGAELYPGTPEELGALVRVEFERYGALVRKLGVKNE